MDCSAVQTIIAFLKTGNLFFIGNACECSVKMIGPGVIRALQCFTQFSTWGLRQSCTAMSADIKVRLKMVMMIANKEDRFRVELQVDK
jgi:hypothetical protein